MQLPPLVVPTKIRIPLHIQSAKSSQNLPEVNEYNEIRSEACIVGRTPVPEVKMRLRSPSIPGHTAAGATLPMFGGTDSCDPCESRDDVRLPHSRNLYLKKQVSDVQRISSSTLPGNFEKAKSTCKEPASEDTMLPDCFEQKSTYEHLALESNSDLESTGDKKTMPKVDILRLPQGAFGIRLRLLIICWPSPAVK